MEPLGETEDEFEALYGDGTGPSSNQLGGDGAKDEPMQVDNLDSAAKDISEQELAAQQPPQPMLNPSHTEQHSISNAGQEPPREEMDTQQETPAVAQGPQISEQTVETPDIGPSTAAVQTQLPGLGQASDEVEMREAEGTKTVVTGNGALTREEATGPGEAEWEADSSPYQSSSDDSSDSSSDGEGGDDDYQLLDPAEQARRLMEDDAGSDDEGGSKGQKGAQLRTHNEQVEEVVTKPDINVTPEMTIEELGNVEAIVDNVAVIKAKTTGEYQVLETQSLLCLADRSVIGVVSETLGRVQEPLYCVRFSSRSSMESDGVNQGTTVFYVPGHSTFVFTKALQAVKGSDASNIYDEEVGGDEIEFSDDEAEAEYKRNLKLQRQAKRNNKTNGRPDGHGRPRGDGALHQPAAMNYDDDAAQDDLYTPLARPANFHQMPGSETVETPGRGSDRGFRGGRGRGDRGRGDRGRMRGRGGRGGSGGPRSDHARPPHALPEKPHMPQHPAQQHGQYLQQANGAATMPPAFAFGSGQPQYGAAPYPYQQPAPQQQQPPYGQDMMQYWQQAAQQFYQVQQQQQQQPHPQPGAYPYQQAQAQAPYPAPQFPPGAAINPRFYHNPNQPHNPQ